MAVIDEIDTAYSLIRSATGGVIGSRTVIKALITSLRTPFLDLHCAVKEEVKEGD